MPNFCQPPTLLHFEEIFPWCPKLVSFESIAILFRILPVTTGHTNYFPGCNSLNLVPPCAPSITNITSILFSLLRLPLTTILIPIRYTFQPLDRVSIINRPIGYT